MAKKLFIAEEKWNTRFGKSARVVVRDAKGHFVDNVSKRQMKTGERELPYVATRQLIKQIHPLSSLQGVFLCPDAARAQDLIKVNYELYENITGITGITIVNVRGVWQDTQYQPLRRTNAYLYSKLQCSSF